MKKAVFFFAIILLAASFVAVSGQENLTRQNWTSKVGFPVDLENLPFKAGDVIDASNADKAAAMLPSGIVTLIKKYGLVIDVKDYKPIVPSDGYIAATNKQLGAAKITDTGSKTRVRGMEGYVSGLPVLKPKSGLELAWNNHYKYTGDDARHNFGVYWISGETGIERSEDWLWNFIGRAMNRTDIAPIPGIPGMAKKEIMLAAFTVTMAPYDKKGFSALYYRYNDPMDQVGWIYLPQQRRTTKFTFGTRGDAWNNTDLLYEDVGGYLGYPEWMHWKIVKKITMYAPMHAEVPLGKDKIKQTWDFENAPHWNPRIKWEPRPMYVVEATPKFRDYPYSKMVCYIDAETFTMPFKDCYDKKGLLWKVILNIANESKDERKYPQEYAGALAVDLQATHATSFCWYDGKPNVGLTFDDFRPTILRKYGR
jgi:Protein of unknown function (DUF1329)